MAGVECRDIFDAVYYYVRGTYLCNRYAANVKSIISNEGAGSQTVKEYVELANEDDVVSDIITELEEKFPFAMASVCANLATLDREYRSLKGFGEQPSFSEFVIDVDEEFPLSERFAFACILYVSSILLTDVDEKRSDELYDKFATVVSKIEREIPFEQKTTVEKYPY